MSVENSLHCVICFEEFSHKDRPPVVLPCGHTFVCLDCSKRLKRCMECREPLFWTPATVGGGAKGPPVLNGNLNTPQPHLRYAQQTLAARRGYSPYRHSIPNQPILQPPPVTQEPVPLPLPKNLVLLDMIESAERQARIMKEAALAEQAVTEERCDSEVSGDAPLDATFAKVATLTGSCGTYAVRDPAGLAVLPFDPNKQHCHHDGTPSPASYDDTSGEEKKVEETREPFTIESGSTVQVVGVDEGVYKLARGSGYVVASVNQLVKVGGPMNESCKLEGMLESVRAREMELQRALGEAQQLAHGLRDKIEFERSQPDTHPVISLPKLLDEEMGNANDENDISGSSAALQEPATPPKIKNTSQSTEEIPLVESSDDSSVVTDIGLLPRLGSHEHHLAVHSPAHSCPGPMTDGIDIDGKYVDGPSPGLPCYRINTEDEFHGISLGFGCGTALFGERLLESHHGDADSLMALSFDDSLVEDANTVGGATVPLPSTNPILHAESPPRNELALRSGSFDGINFRTGMSGHRGLSAARKKSSPSAPPRQVRMMSVHSGIGAARAAAARRANAAQLAPRTPYMPSPEKLQHI